MRPRSLSLAATLLTLCSLTVPRAQADEDVLQAKYGGVKEVKVVVGEIPECLKTKLCQDDERVWVTNALRDGKMPVKSDAANYVYLCINAVPVTRGDSETVGYAYDFQVSLCRMVVTAGGLLFAKVDEERVIGFANAASDFDDLFRSNVTKYARRIADRWRAVCGSATTDGKAPDSGSSS